MPRVQIYLRDLDEVETLEEGDDWEEQIGVRAHHERRVAQFGSAEARNARGNVRGAAETIRRKYSERRKEVRRGGKRM